MSSMIINYITLHDVSLNTWSVFWYMAYVFVGHTVVVQFPCHQYALRCEWLTVGHPQTSSNYSINII